MVFHHSRSSAYIKWQQDWNNTLLQSNNKNQKSAHAHVCWGSETVNGGISAKIRSWKQKFQRAWKVGKVSWLRVEVLEGIKCGEECVWRLTSWLGLWRQRAEQALPGAPVCSALVMDPAWGLCLYSENGASWLSLCTMRTNTSLHRNHRHQLCPKSKHDPLAVKCWVSLEAVLLPSNPPHVHL